MTAARTIITEEPLSREAQRMAEARAAFYRATPLSEEIDSEPCAAVIMRERRS